LAVFNVKELLFAERGVQNIAYGSRLVAFKV